VLRQVAQAGLLKGKAIGIDATTLEANAAMKSIVRRDTQESYTDYLKRLAEAEGLEATDEAALRRMDRRRSKKGSNADWINPHDPEAQITRMKDGRTALAYKAEHAVDLDTGAIVAVTAHEGAARDTASIQQTLPAAGEAVVEQIPQRTAKGEHAVTVEAGKSWWRTLGYHAGPVLAAVREAGVRTYVSEPGRGRRKWTGKREQQAAVYANRRRIGGNRGQQLLRRRGELLERTFVHAHETGALRRVYVRGKGNVQKKRWCRLASPSAAPRTMFTHRTIPRSAPRCWLIETNCCCLPCDPRLHRRVGHAWLTASVTEIESRHPWFFEALLPARDGGSGCVQSAPDLDVGPPSASARISRARKTSPAGRVRDCATLRQGRRRGPQYIEVT
jgi:hypothetical protein